jgi:hypothetical protein
MARPMGSPVVDANFAAKLEATVKVFQEEVPCWDGGTATRWWFPSDVCCFINLS